MKTADLLLAFPFHHRCLDALAVAIVAGLFWRFSLSHWALAANRARALRWRTRCRLRPGPGFATLPELVTAVGPPGRRLPRRPGPPRLHLPASG